MLNGVIIAFRLTLGSVFLIAGLIKLPQMSGFAEDIQQYRLLPKPIVKIVAFTLPSVEVMLSIALLTGVSPAIVGVLAAGLMASFLVALLSALWRKLNVSCPCFGLLYRREVGPKTLLRDLVLLMMSLSIVVWGELPQGLLQALSSSATKPASLAIVMATLVSLIGSMYLSFLALRSAQAIFSWPAFHLWPSRSRPSFL